MTHEDMLADAAAPVEGLELTGAQSRALMSALCGCRDLREFGRSVLQTVVNSMMDAQAQRACGAARNERSGSRTNSRNGYRPRSLSTALGDLELRVPKLREGSYYPEGILRRYTRVEASMVALVQELYVAGVSTRKVEGVAAELGVSSLSSSEVSALCAGLDEEAEAFRSRPLGGEPHPYVWLDATYVKCRVGGRYESVALVTAIGLARSGHKEFLGCECVDCESEASWLGFLRGLRARGLTGVRLVVSDAHAGLVSAIGQVFLGCSWQRCVTHLQRDLAGHVRGRRDRALVAELVRRAVGQRDPEVARRVWDLAAPAVRARSRAAGDVFEGARDSALAFMGFPRPHWPKLRTNNVQERANREIKRRYRSVQSFPSEASMMRLVCAVLAGEEGRWANQRVFSEASVAEALRDPGPQGAPGEERLEAVELAARAALADLVDPSELAG